MPSLVQRKRQRERETLEWLDNVEQRGVTKSFRSLRAAFRQSTPGGWATDHYEETLHFSGWNYVAIRAKALQAAQADLECFTTTETSKRRKTILGRHGAYRKAYGDMPIENRIDLGRQHPLVKLLHRPNPKQWGGALRYELSVQLNLTGTAMIVKIRNSFGLPVELYVVPTALMTPQPPTNECPYGCYRVSPAATRVSWQDDSFVDMVGYQRLAGCLIDARDLVTIRWPHPIWKDEGYGAVSASALTTDTSEMIERARWSHFKQGFMADIMLVPPDSVNPTEQEIDRIVAKLSAEYGGVEHNGKIFVAPGGTKVEQLGATPKEMAYFESWPQLRDALLAIHGTPGIAAGIQDGGSYAAFYTSLLQFIRLTVQPELTWVAFELMHQLAPYFGEGIEIGLNAQSIDDPNLLEEQLKTDISSGSIRRREYRSVRGLEPLGTGDDDELIGKTTERANVAGQVGGPGGDPTGGDQNMPSHATRTEMAAAGQRNAAKRHRRLLGKALRRLTAEVITLKATVEEASREKPGIAKTTALALPAPQREPWELEPKPAEERKPWEYL